MFFKYLFFMICYKVITWWYGFIFLVTMWLLKINSVWVCFDQFIHYSLCLFILLLLNIFFFVLLCEWQEALWYVWNKCMSEFVVLLLVSAMIQAGTPVVVWLASRCHEVMALCCRGADCLPVSCPIWGSVPHNPSGSVTTEIV